jgi:hypothetical protein
MGKWANGQTFKKTITMGTGKLFAFHYFILSYYRIHRRNVKQRNF